MWGILGVARSAAGPALLHCAVSILVVPMFITTAVAVVPVIEIARNLETKYQGELPLVR